MSEFQWDLQKAASNLKKHGVAFAEALTVFADPEARIFDDPDHSVDERREIIVGTRDIPACWSWAPRNGDVVFASSRRDAPRGLRRNVMKRTRSARTEADDLRGEYEFDYGKSRKNRFATGGAPTIAVVLEPDVARVFSSAAKVNRLLRSVIRAVPGTAVDRKRRAG
jgi:uncharacterized DUF497 family protein